MENSNDELIRLAKETKKKQKSREKNRAKKRENFTNMYSTSNS